MKNFKVSFGLIFVILNLVLLTSLIRAEEAAKQIPVSEWLILGPIKSKLPLFHQDKNPKGDMFGLDELLSFHSVDFSNWWPIHEEVVQWDKMTQLIWQKEAVDTENNLQLNSNHAGLEYVFAAAYIHVDRFVKATIEISGNHLFECYMDGDKLFAQTKSKVDDRDSQKSKEVNLESGTHLVLIKTLKDPDCKLPWNLNGNLKLLKPFRENEVQINLDPAQRMTIKHLLDGPKVAGVAISPSGELAAVTIRESQPPGDRSENWIELRDTRSGELVQTFRGGMAISGLTWAPVGSKFSYTTSSKKNSSLWVVDLNNGSSTRLLKDLENFGRHSWSPDGSFIVYSVTEEAPKNRSGLKKLRGMTDHQPGWRDRSYLYLVNYPEGTKRRLTSGTLSTDLNGISPDGTRLVFTRSVVDYSERPYEKTEFYLLDLPTLELDSLFSTKWSGSAQWSPDGKKLLLIGGPSMFGKIGVNVPRGRIPNEYDNQAYIYDLTVRGVEPITKNFNPSIAQAFWSVYDGNIYFNCEDGSYRHLYRYDMKTRQFERLDTGIDVLGSFDLARSQPLTVYTGSGTSVPPKAYVLDLQEQSHRLLVDPGERDYKYVKFGQTERWTFKNKRGVEIEGRIYYPPDFDPVKKYPCIVYYYGGTSPVSRDFGGRYPKEVWAGSGYVVYVLQPSGATGFGQEFSALHVNDWGKIVADEIIEGTKKFLKVHPFVDEQKVGCIGASFGGFMTILLQTKTDIFATAIAHAGISSISSYWGEGLWGYSYSAIATANSFPWNRKDIYVDQSPLFHADKVKSPILLLHGNADTNVPPGESRQFYTALKLLGKDVELIEIDGQNHHILAYNKRKLWSKTIIAWFDRWLKNQPEWWETLYPVY